jgi:hypothetical protein
VRRTAAWSCVARTATKRSKQSACIGPVASGGAVDADFLDGGCRAAVVVSRESNLGSTGNRDRNRERERDRRDARIAGQRAPAATSASGEDSPPGMGWNARGPRPVVMD